MPQEINDFSYLELRGDAGMFFEKRMENDGNGNPIYVGFNRTQNADVDESSWFIVKITYSGTAVTRYQLPDNGPQFKYDWTNRANFFI